MSAMKTLILALALFGVSCSTVQPSTQTSLEVLWVGTYSVESSTRVDDPSTATGTVLRSIGTKPLEKTTQIPARIGVRFGFGYRLIAPNAVSPVILKTVKLYPPGGMTNPANGRTVERYEGLLPCNIVVTCWTGFAFEQPWELIPGIWTMQIWQGSTLLANQVFNVVSP